MAAAVDKSAAAVRDDAVFERPAEQPMRLWAEAGENLLPIVPLLGPDAPPADGVDDRLPRPGCQRPVHGSSPSHTLTGAGPVPVIRLCKLCADGSTLHSLRQAAVPVDPEHRAVAAVMA
ncbi:hypothetical protein ACFV2Q_04375 [Streptomyces sp. NPDC059650]|uniref:hypothetical protein n=1 Tax=Streptomyces sp. NPDC059650 TaxID=3346896 RepID=UPI0036BA822E